MMVSMKKIQSKQILNEEDLAYLNKLLKTNIPLANGLKLIKRKGNEKIIDELLQKLDEGMLIERIIESYIPSNLNGYLSPLIKNLPFSIAIDISLSFYDRVKQNEKQIMNSLAYPCILLFVSLTALYLFDLYGIDSIFMMLKSFNSNIALFSSLRILFRAVVYVFYYGILILALFALYFSRPKRIVFLYLQLSKHFPNSLVNISYCEQFVSLLLICSQRGYKTKQALELLKSMKSKPVISFLAFHLDESLLNGETLRDASKQIYYDNSLSRFIKIATYSNDFNNVLAGYVNLAKEKIQKKIKKYTISIQLVTYIFIGLIIVFIYQILFLPLQALSNI